MSERPTGWEGADRWFATPGTGDGPGTPPPPPPPPDEAPEPAPLPRCEACGAELEADQTYCLECGAPTPLAPRLRRGGRNLAVLAGAIALLGIGAGALAYAVAEDDEATATATATVGTIATGPVVPLPPPTVVTTGPLPPDTSFTTVTVPTAPTSPTTVFGTVTSPGTVIVPPATVPGPVTPPATTTASPPTTTEQVPPPIDPDTGSSDWPAGVTAWTAILSSVRDESDARAAKGRVSGDGLPAGVLFSSDFPELRPGYWVVFSGRYGDRGDAIAQATRLRPRFPGAYARRLSG